MNDREVLLDPLQHYFDRLFRSEMKLPRDLFHPQARLAAEQLVVEAVRRRRLFKCVSGEMRAKGVKALLGVPTLIACSTQPWRPP